VSSTPEAVAGDALLVFDPNQQIPVADLADVERTHRENGRTEYTDVLDLSNVVATEFTDWALEQLGAYGE
ncbi:MAG: hypothetical protein WCY60_03405, partial [Trueperaceae bacterium]